jgi:CDP-glucose 4,6-dehydratase
MELGQSSVEKLVMTTCYKGIYSGVKVLVTGHTGFKGSWLITWLKMLGADVAGYAYESSDNTRHYSLLKPNIKSVTGDILDLKKLTDTINHIKPEIVFHLAAQALVRRSYNEPIQTYQSNVIGTLNVYEACRQCDSVRAVVSITSDKVYENKEKLTPYCEDDQLGGYDMYSSSKACVEIMTNAYRNSFLNPQKSIQAIKLVTARAGNVIGGGDWAEDRLVPDIMRAIENKQKVVVRNPKAVRPWQHVLEPLSGYLLLGQYLFEGNTLTNNSFNFGPSADRLINVEELVELIKEIVKDVEVEIKQDANAPHEAGLLAVDSLLARNVLQWQPVWNASEGIYRTSQWYHQFLRQGIVNTEEDIARYVKDAADRNMIWANS